ncbi:hypothetical protein BASA81_004176 [Batrachochytrium salamandrivorans]|nr:hypothetical protein BASA81_004176 [Batrachochytrium salamandrivorans]
MHSELEQAVSVAKRWRGDEDNNDDHGGNGGGEVFKPPILNLPASPTPNGQLGHFQRSDDDNGNDTRDHQENGKRAPISSDFQDQGELERVLQEADGLLGKPKREKNPPEHLPSLPACFFLHDLLGQRA